tara:strand:- start:2522 stop:4603 length:2082 start_codon:yes stop_codon:yes gene_type:complete
LTFLFIFTSLTCYTQGTKELKLNWVISSGSAGKDVVRGIKALPSGEVYTTGFFEQTVDFDPGSNSLNLSSSGGKDAFICKYSPQGGLVWAVSLSGSNEVYGTSLDYDSIGNIYITGTFVGTVDFDPSPNTFNLVSNGSDDVFLVKLDSQGNFIWAKNFGSNAIDKGQFIKVQTNNMILISGRFSGIVDFDPNSGTTIVNGSNSSNIFVSAFDSTGNLIWNNSFISANNSSLKANAFEIDIMPNNGNHIIVGTFFGTVNFDGGSGTANLTSNGLEDCFMAVYDTNGTHLWSTSWGGVDGDFCNTVKVDSKSNIYVGGAFRGSVDFDPGSINMTKISSGFSDMFISKFNSSGNLIWNRTIGGSNQEIVNKLSVDQDGFVYACGYFYSNSLDADPSSGSSSILQNSGNSDGILWSLDSSGNYNTAYAIGGSSLDNGLQMTFNHVNEIFIGGLFSSTVDFDPSNASYSLSSNGGNDLFVQSVKICKTAYDSINAFGCQFYLSPGGQVLTTNGVYQDTILSQNGCDSIITINLILNQLDTNVIDSGTMLKASTFQNVSYQWLDCNNGYSAISGATQHSFTPTASGSYAVELSQGACKDTSACKQITLVGLSSIINEYETTKVFPNPTNERIWVRGCKEFNIKSIKVYNLSGQLLIEKNIVDNDWHTNNFSFKINEPSGVYILELKSDDKITRHKVIKR